MAIFLECSQSQSLMAIKYGYQQPRPDTYPVRLLITYSTTCYRYRNRTCTGTASRNKLLLTCEATSSSCGNCTPLRSTFSPKQHRRTAMVTRANAALMSARPTNKTGCLGFSFQNWLNPTSLLYGQLAELSRRWNRNFRVLPDLNLE